MVTVRGLDGLSDIGSYLLVRGNTSLEEVLPLSQVRYVSGAVMIEDNPALPNCLAEELAFEAIGGENIWGTILIASNLDACPE